MRLLVTGGCGFAGSAFLRQQLALPGGSTAALNGDALSYAATPAAVAMLEGDNRYHFLSSDIVDGASMAAAIREFHPDAIINFADETHVDRSIDAAAPFLQPSVDFDAGLAATVDWYLAALDERTAPR